MNNRDCVNFLIKWTDEKNRNITYRVFECSQTLFDTSTMFLVIEKDNALQVQHGTRDDFKKYFNNVGWSWGGWS